MENLSFIVPLGGLAGPLPIMRPDYTPKPESCHDVVAIIAEYRPVMRAYIVKLSRKYTMLDGEDINDIEQDAHLRLINGALRSFRGDCPLGLYLCKFVARSAFIDYLRKFIPISDSTAGPVDEEEIDRRAVFDRHAAFDRRAIFGRRVASGRQVYLGRRGAGFERALEDREMLEFVKAEAARLPAKQRCIFAMIAFDEMKQEDVAQRLGFRQSTVSEHYAKARELVFSAFKKRYPDTEFT